MNVSVLQLFQLRKMRHQIQGLALPVQEQKLVQQGLIQQGLVQQGLVQQGLVGRELAGRVLVEGVHVEGVHVEGERRTLNSSWKGKNCSLGIYEVPGLELVQEELEHQELELGLVQGQLELGLVRGQPEPGLVQGQLEPGLVRGRQRSQPPGSVLVVRD